MFAWRILIFAMFSPDFLIKGAKSRGSVAQLEGRNSKGATRRAQLEGPNSKVLRLTGYFYSQQYLR